MKTKVPLVELSGAGVNRSGRWIARNITLSVKRGEIVTLIGPNGSGKSTTAKMALNIISCDEGTSALKAGTVVSYVPQRLDIDWSLPLTVDRFLRLGQRAKKTDIDWAVERTSIGPLLSNPLGSVSGGEFQRVQLARAISRKPDLLVLDEPSQGLDMVGQGKMYDLVGAIRDELNCGVLLVSHDLHIVMAATDRVYCLNGHVCCSGTPKAVADSAEFKGLFGGVLDPSMAVYEHQHDHTHLPDGRVQHADGSITDNCKGHGHHHEATPRPDAEIEKAVSDA